MLFRSESTSATNVDSCTSRGRIRVSGEPGSGDIFVGGLVGSERYGTVQNSTSSVKMEVSNLTSAQTGGISGEFNGTYGMIGAASGIKTTVIQNCTFNGSMLFKDVAAPRQGEINGAGVPEPLSSPWGISMDYKIENCTAAPSADLSFLRSLLDKYGFSSHYWAYHRDIFGIYDEASGKWNQPVLKSLNLK